MVDQVMDLHNGACSTCIAIKPEDLKALSGDELAATAAQMLAHIVEQSRHIGEQSKRIDTQAQAIKWWASPSFPDTSNDMMCSGDRHDKNPKELHGRIQT